MTLMVGGNSDGNRTSVTRERLSVPVPCGATEDAAGLCAEQQPSGTMEVYRLERFATGHAASVGIYILEGMSLHVAIVRVLSFYRPDKEDG